MAYKKILIICKQDHPGARALGEDIRRWLKEKGIQPDLIDAQDQYEFKSLPDLAIVLGGDGTILGIARQLAGTSRPILGINFGRVGFLATLDPDSWRSGLEAAIAGQLECGAYLALAWELRRGDSTVQGGIAINDIVVGRGCLARLTVLSLTVAGKCHGEIRSDGLVVSSPIGSSGYFASAGGAIIAPQLEAVGIAAICPFMSRPAPLVVSPSAAIEIGIASASNDCFLTIDGQIGFPLQKHDLVVVRGRPQAVHFLAGAGNLTERRVRRSAQAIR